MRVRFPDADRLLEIVWSQDVVVVGEEEQLASGFGDTS
jgi:hypothetical protein